MINDRIAFLISALKYNPNSFADKVGVSTTVIYNIIKGRRNKPSYDLLIKILNVFDQINTEWLLTGEGNGWLNEVENNESAHKIEDRLEFLIQKITSNPKASVISQELAELSEILLDEIREKERTNRLLAEQNEQMVAILRERLGLRI
jgi:transcriptional regulator with XRE-family HTH domain